MPARTRRIAHDVNTRSKIQAAQLINRLTKHAMGEIELTPQQVRSIEILLRKVLPDLQSLEIEMDASVERRISPEPMTAEQWAEKHKPH